MRAQGKLGRSLRLVDVYAISTGAMFSSGFFLLPGIAYAYGGPLFVFAYLISAAVVIPAMLSKAELASAMPRAGGTYYFLDRSMGPLVGTVGGLGTWVSLGLKNTFAVIGIGAYVALFVDVEMTPIAIGLTAFFTFLNLVGTKESAQVQRWLVYALVTILSGFVVAGFATLWGPDFVETTRQTFVADPYGSNPDSLLATVGLVFVSYAGLTKVVGLAEEIQQPRRNVILGMGLSLGTAAVIYTLGAFVLWMTLEPHSFARDYTPVASSAEIVFGWMPGRLGVLLVFAAALAAFASTANAGIMSASRYLLAMGRDKLVPSRLAKIGRAGTPTWAVLATGGFIVAMLLTLDVVSVAKLASAFQLLMFAMVNLAVIVMRESRIREYDPGFRSPLYPWTQIVGIFVYLFLIVEMGRLPILFSFALVLGAVLWFFAYAKRHVVRRGAILHWFERLGRDRFHALEQELAEILADHPDMEEIVDQLVVYRVDPAQGRTGSGVLVLPRDHVLERLEIGRRMGGRTLADVALQSRYGLTVVAVDVMVAPGRFERRPPLADEVLHEGDRIVVVGTREQVVEVASRREDAPTGASAPLRQLPFRRHG